MDSILVAALDVGRTKVPPTDPPPYVCAYLGVERRLEHGLNRPGKAGPSACHQFSSRIGPTPPLTCAVEA
jgi:hypothetical protein